ncbi:G-X-X-X-Q-X-W domain-containing protein [Pholiota molesta]|nr:G-X-X-X-Q-X-W domain-containing protein [Pholiota molesta]
MLSLPLSSLVLLATPLVAASSLLPRQTTPTRQYVVTNRCPTAVNLYIGGALDSNIPQNGSVTKTLGTSAGFFYTDANLGSPTAEGAAKAGFLGDDVYYLVTDTTYINVGISVAPREPASNGFCVPVECDTRDCTSAFTSPPTGGVPASSTPPNPPYFRCPTVNATYDITFCPTGQFPDQKTTIHPDFTTQKCIDVRGAVLANGTPVQIYDCNGTPAQNWLFTRGSTKVQLAGTNFCLDAGSSPANGIGLKIWQCFDNLPAQQWFYTDDDRIALDGQGTYHILLHSKTGPGLNEL